MSPHSVCPCSTAMVLQAPFCYHSATKGKVCTRLGAGQANRTEPRDSLAVWHGPHTFATTGLAELPQHGCIHALKASKARGRRVQKGHEVAAAWSLPVRTWKISKGFLGSIVCEDDLCYYSHPMSLSSSDCKNLCLFVSFEKQHPEGKNIQS